MMMSGDLVCQQMIYSLIINIHQILMKFVKIQLNLLNNIFYFYNYLGPKFWNLNTSTIHTIKSNFRCVVVQARSSWQ